MRVAVDQRQVAQRDVRLPGELLGRVEDHLAAQGGAERVDPQAAREPAAHRRLESEHLLGRACRSRCRPPAVSSVSRWGKYHSVPSASLTPVPENIVAKRLIGVSAPWPFQPRTAPVVSMPLPRWAWAAISRAGEVPDVERVPVLGEVGDRHRGGEAERREQAGLLARRARALGSIRAAVDPVALKSPA